MPARGRIWSHLLLLGALGAPSMAFGEEQLERVLEDSLPLRQALHTDPTLDTPLQHLVRSFSEHDLVQDLIGIYRAHCQAYPQDAYGRIVLIRILHSVGAPEARTASQQATRDFPENAYLHYLAADIVLREDALLALSHLTNAVGLSDDPIQVREWSELVIEQAIGLDEDEIVTAHLQRIAEAAGESAAGLLEAAELMLEHDHDGEALTTLEKALGVNNDPEQGITLTLAAADAEQRLGRISAASERLDTLLSRLTAEYWRRPEILDRRLELASDADDRDALVASAAERETANPADEAAAIDHARILWGFDRRREAIERLIDASDRIPTSRTLERQILAYLDRLRDDRGREAFLERRLEADPERQDLAWELADASMRLGRLKTGLERGHAVLASLSEAEQGSRWLELGRVQRRDGDTRAAVASLAAASQRLPLRLDARRELAEALIELGRRGTARRVLSAEISPDAASEHLLDLVAYLVSERMLNQAAIVLEQRRSHDPRNLEVHLRLIRVYARLGAGRQGSVVAEAARGFADTPARYRRWLEATLSLHQELDTVGDFIDAESATLLAEENIFGDRGMLRIQHLLEIAQREDDTKAAAILASVMTMEIPEDRREHFARLEVEIQVSLDDPPAELAPRLEELIAAGTSDANRLRAHLAVLYNGQERHDLTRGALLEVEPTTLENPDLLRDIVPILQRYRLDRQHRAALEKLISLEPDSRQHWENWITALAYSGSEQALQRALRRLLAGVEEIPITDETADLLRAHLIDSAWRNLAQRLADDDQDDLRRSLDDLDILETQVNDDLTGLWVAAARALVLNRVNDAAARDDQIGETTRRVAEIASEYYSDLPHDVALERIRITFPDGLAIGGKELQHVLTWTPPSPISADPQGPEGDLVPIWERELGANLVGLAGDAAGTVIALDEQGTLTAIDATTGKLRWIQQRIAAVPVIAGRQIQTGRHSYRHLDGLASGSPPVVIDDRIIVADHDPISPSLICLAIADGSLLWRAPLPVSGSSSEIQATFHLATAGKRLLSFDGASMRLQARDAVNGRLVWDQPLSDTPNNIPLGHVTAGMEVGDGLAVAWGSRTSIVDLTTGAILWEFDPIDLNQFPIELIDPEVHGRSSSDQRSTFATGSGRWHPGSRNSTQVISHMRSSRRPPSGGASFAIGAPAAAWTQPQDHFSPRRAVICSGNLILMGERGQSVLDLGLPLKPLDNWVGGHHIGVAAGIKVSVDQANLRLFDPHTGDVQTISLQDISGGDSDLVSAAVDGSRVYASGRNGVLAVNARSGSVVAKTIWQESIDVDPALTAMRSFSYTPAAVMAYTNHGPPANLRTVGTTSAGVLVVPTGLRRMNAVGRVTDFPTSEPEDEVE